MTNNSYLQNLLFLISLQEGAEEEAADNEAEQQRQLEKKLRYGQIVQVRGPIPHDDGIIQNATLIFMNLSLIFSPI